MFLLDLQSRPNCRVLVQASSSTRIIQVDRPRVVVYNGVLSRLGHNLIKDGAAILLIIASFPSDGNVRKKLEFTIQLKIPRRHTRASNMAAHLGVPVGKFAVGRLGREMRVPDTVGKLTRSGHIRDDIAHDTPGIESVSKL